MSEAGEPGIVIGGGGGGHTVQQRLLLGMGNRHGLIAGATGTGKTVTLQILAEEFSGAGVPVFLSDIKGDVSGMAAPGSAEGKAHGSFMARAATIGIDLQYRAMPVTFWDLFGEQGHPVRTTVAEMGPLLLSRLLGLTDVQEGVLNVAFRVADEQGLPVLDLADLKALLIWCGQNARELSLAYGNVTTASVGAIQRSLLVLKNQGGNHLFGEPALDLADLMRRDGEGRGMVNILAADRLMSSPRLYATFLLWLLSELFEVLPEVGNPDKPVLVFFFDEAHLLFSDAPKALVEKVEQVARLIRSKGVGVYFITQNPADVPESVLSQLGNRIQHALRAFTAKDRKDLEKAAQTYRDNPRFATVDAIREVGTGEAVTSLLDRKGVPEMVEKTLIRPPASQMGPLDPGLRAGVIAASPLGAKYGTRVDRDSAHEMLARRAAEAASAAEAAETADDGFNRARRYDGGRVAKAPAVAPKGRQPKGFGEALTEAAVKELSGTTGRRIVRGILGGVFRGK
jgi:DNA helicase HerA-like ATPase